LITESKIKTQKNIKYGYQKIYIKYIGIKVYFVFFLSTVSALLDGLGIVMLLPLLSSVGGFVTNNPNQGFLNKFLLFIGATTTGRILFFISLVFFIKGVFKFFEGAYRAQLQARLLKELKQKMFVGFEKMNYQYYMSRNAGHFLNVINEQINQFSGSFQLYSLFIAGIILSIVYFTIALTIAWRFALFSLFFGMILLFILKTLNKFVKELSRKFTYETGELNKYLVQTLHGFKYATSTNKLQYIKSSTIKSIGSLARHQKTTKIIVAFSNAIKEPMAVSILMVIIAFQIIYMEALFGPIAVTLLLFYRGVMSITSIQTLWQKFIGKIGSIEIVENEFFLLHREQVIDGVLDVSSLREGIEFKNVSFFYNENVSALLNINLLIPAYSTIGIVGKSGAGKSTLVDILTILLKPTKGELLIDGMPTDNIRLATWRDQIGYVCQDSVMYDDTIANNIGLWTGGYNSDEKYKVNIHKAAKLARADIFIDELNEGYETLIGDRGVRLSGGQRQRLFIARELFKNPDLLILDEATSALDSESEKYIQESIDALKGKMTVVIIAHRLSTIKNVDQIYVFDKGSIVQAGSFSELQKSEDSRFRKMVEIQAL
jgi:ABC-type multidrug transport system fused ATPase/permease subunit